MIDASHTGRGADSDQHGNPDFVEVTINIEISPRTETARISRRDWDSWAPSRRRAEIQSLCDDELANAGGYGWHIDDPQDLAAANAADPEDLDEQVVLAREATAAGLVVTQLMPIRTDRPGPQEYAVQLWTSAGTLWAEGRYETADMVRRHISNYQSQPAAAR